MTDSKSQYYLRIVGIIFNFPTFFIIISSLMCCCVGLYLVYRCCYPRKRKYKELDKKEKWLRKRMMERRNDYTRGKNLKVVVVTWNVGSEVFRDVNKLNDLLRMDEEPDIIAVGLQEIDMSVKSFLFQTPVVAEWNNVFSRFVRNKPYRIVLSRRFGGLYNIVILKNVHVGSLSDIRSDTKGTGYLGGLPNKGGLAIRFGLYESSFCFLNCHLMHGREKVKRRNQDFERCMKAIDFNGDSEFYHLRVQDCLFWYGDLNYRLNLTHAQVIENLVDKEYLRQHDQLLPELKDNNSFAGFREGEVEFDPSYKFVKKGERKFENLYDEKRTPSFPDRILFRCDEDVEVVEYSMEPTYFISDHKPVVGVYNVVAKEKVVVLYDDILKMINDELQEMY